MEELVEILKQHAACYPMMEPVDAVKLIYQNEFGGGHLIRDEKLAWKRLEEECSAVKYNADMPKFESLGNGIRRVYLAALTEEELPWLWENFLTSARTHRGELSCFLGKLEVLKQVTAEGVFRFGTEELRSYLSDYEKAGYPMVSHSEQYRSAYRPAYRIICE